MTRQKKELIKQIDEIYARTAKGENMDDKTYARLYNLSAELAKLRHYDSVIDMLYDEI